MGSGDLMGQKRGDFGRVLSAGQFPCSLEVADSSRFGMWIFWSGQKLPQVLAVPCLPVQSASVYLRPLDHWPATPVSFSVLPPQTAAPKRSWGGRNVVLSFLLFFASLFLYELLHAVLSCFIFQVFFILLISLCFTLGVIFSTVVSAPTEFYFLIVLVVCSK